MIIECPNCNRKFNLDKKLIPKNERTLKCSGCKYVWLYKINVNKNIEDQKISADKNVELNINISKKDIKDDEINKKINDKDISSTSEEVLSEIKIKDKEVETKNEANSEEKKVKLKIIYIYFIILIISLLGLIFLLDTFKDHLSNVFPGVIPIFDSLYETLLDLKLFFKDLIN